jgi:2-dehydropantoate 2-reductase
MKTLIMGAGAVGGYFGAKLSKAGDTVYLVARGAHLDAIQRFGLRVTGTIGDYVAHLPADSDPAAFGITPDLILMGVKSMDTAGAIEQLRPVMGPNTQILAIQNGIGNYPLMAVAFGAHRVIRGYCRVGSEIVEPGHIHQTAFGDIVFGEEDGSMSARIKAVDELLTRAEIVSKPTNAIVEDVWKKFAWNVMFNMTTGLTGVTIDRVFAHPESEAVLKKLFGEVAQAASFHGVSLTEANYKAITDPMRPMTGYKTSTMQDRLKGKLLEHDIFLGYLSAEGRRNGFPTPVADLLYGLFKTLDP